MVKKNNTVGRKKKSINEVDLDKRLCISVHEAAEMLGISPNNLYLLIKEHKIPAIRLGKRILISKIGLEEFIAKGGVL